MPKKKIEEQLQEIEGEQKEKEEVKDAVVVEKEVRHPQFTNIRGGICEFCGKPVEECEFYSLLFKEKKFNCLCGSHNNPSTFYQSIYRYWEKHKTWICNAEGCRRRVEILGGYRDPEILNFYLYQ